MTWFTDLFWTGYYYAHRGNSLVLRLVCGCTARVEGKVVRCPITFRGKVYDDAWHARPGVWDRQWCTRHKREWRRMLDTADRLAAAATRRQTTDAEAAAWLAELQEARREMLLGEADGERTRRRGR